MIIIANDVGIKNMGEEFELRQMTCREFKWKVQQAMQSSGLYPLTGTVHVDEFYVDGEEEEGKKERGKGSKRLIIVALEVAKGGFERVYAVNIKDASSSFMPFSQKYIDKNDDVVTDEWAGYKPQRTTYKNLRQIPSNEGKNFPELHIHIMNIKSCLRGIHHHCSEERLQGYLDEYHFRFNRRNNMDTIFDVLMRRMVCNEPKRLNKRIKLTAT